MISLLGKKTRGDMSCGILDENYTDERIDLKRNTFVVVMDLIISIGY